MRVRIWNVVQLDAGMVEMTDKLRRENGPGRRRGYQVHASEVRIRDAFIHEPLLTTT